MFLLNMNYKLTSESAYGHSDNIRIRYFSFDSTEESEEGVAWQ